MADGENPASSEVQLIYTIYRINPQWHPENPPNIQPNHILTPADIRARRRFIYSTSNSRGYGAKSTVSHFLRRTLSPQRPYCILVILFVHLGAIGVIFFVHLGVKLRTSSGLKLSQTLAETSKSSDLWEVHPQVPGSLRPSLPQL